MKHTKPIKFLSSALLGLALALPLQADFKTDARQVVADHAQSVYGLRGLLEISATMNGQPAGSQERPLFSNAAVIGEGLLVAAYKSLKPNLAANVGNRPGLEINSELSELKLIDESGEEYDAKLILHDEVLGVAFVALDPKGENAGDFSGAALDISADAEVGLLDELLAIGRLPESMRFQAQARKGSVSAIVKRPRKLIHVSGIGPSTPVFNQQGVVVGFNVIPKSRPGESAIPVVLPCKYVRELVEQAKEKQAALADEESGEETEGDAEE